MYKILPAYSRNRKKTSTAGIEGVGSRGVRDAVRGAVGGNRGIVETHRPTPEGLDRMISPPLTETSPRPPNNAEELSFLFS